MNRYLPKEVESLIDHIDDNPNILEYRAYEKKYQCKNIHLYPMLRKKSPQDAIVF